MNFQLDQNTVILALVIVFLIWYFYQSSKETLRNQRGIQTGRQSVGKRGKLSPVVVAAIPTPAPVAQVAAAVAAAVAAPPPPKAAPPVSEGELDLAGLL